MSSSSNTRKRSSPQGQTSYSNGDKSPLNVADNLPPSRTSDSMRTVSPPLSSTRLNRFIYLLVGLTALLCAFYTYRLVQHKRNVGGWWNVALGRQQQNTYTQTWQENGAVSHNTNKYGYNRGNEVEERLNALADALGMPSKELASAIAGAVRAYVPPASMSSVAAKETGEAVKVLLSEPEAKEQEAATKQDGSPGVVGGIIHGVGSFAGMDEPAL